MTATALVTGSAARVNDVALALERQGVTALRIIRGEDLAGAAARVADRSVEHYLQLPGDVASPGTTKVGELAALVARGVLKRFDEVAVLLPKLAPNCAVVLVTGDTVSDLSSVAYPHAPTCLLEMLADAIVTDLAPVPARATVVSHCHSAERIAAIALATGPQHGAVVAGFAAEAPEMDFSDWRLAYLSAAGAGA